MKTKYILISIGTLLIGGTLGFIICMQIQSNKIDSLLKSDDKQPSVYERYSPDSHTNMNRQNRPDFNKTEFPPIVKEIIRDLQLTANQQKEIEIIIQRSNLSKRDIQQMNLDKLQPVLSNIYTVLNDEQRSKLDEIIAQQAINSLIN